MLMATSQQKRCLFIAHFMTREVPLVLWSNWSCSVCKRTGS